MEVLKIKQWHKKGRKKDMESPLSELRFLCENKIQI